MRPSKRLHRKHQRQKRQLTLASRSYSLSFPFLVSARRGFAPRWAAAFCLPKTLRVMDVRTPDGALHLLHSDEDSGIAIASPAWPVSQLMIRFSKIDVGWVPCFRGSLAIEGSVQNHCENMCVLQSPHAFAVANLAQRYCQSSAKAWHPRPVHYF